jgi:hypothetical protein
MWVNKKKIDIDGRERKKEERWRKMGERGREKDGERKSPGNTPVRLGS